MSTRVECARTPYRRCVISAVSTRSRRRHVAGWAWFWSWVVVGVGAASAAVSLGPILALPIAVIAVAMASQPSIRRSALGLLTGVGVVLLYVAYAQRHGPGTTCWHTATASGCDQHLNPIPWLVIGLVFLIGGVVAYAKRSP